MYTQVTYSSKYLFAIMQMICETSSSHYFIPYQKFHAGVISFIPLNDEKKFIIDMAFQKLRIMNVIKDIFILKSNNPYCMSSLHI